MGFRDGRLTAQQLLSAYCALLYRQLGSYSEVAARTGLDCRTVRRHIAQAHTGAAA